MAQGVFELRDILIDQLTELIQHTEEIYLRLAQHYPTLLREMEKSLAQSDETVAALRGSGNDSVPQDVQISTIVGHTRDVIQRATTSFQAMHARDDELFGALDRGIERLSSLEEVISRIREDSIEMELISLNAMTVALKAGSAGRAFSYITDELKRLAATTISFTDELTKQGNQLLQTFHEFRSAVTRIREFQENLFNQFQTRLLESFEAIRTGMNTILDTLGSITAKARDVKQPLLRIMEEIQLQDIIKQSVEHVIISLNEMRDLPDSVSTEERLDEMQFLATLPDLCSSVLTFVSEKISESESVFQSNAESSKKIITAVETERSEFVDTALAGGGRSGSLSSLFDQSIETLSELIGDLERSIELKEHVTSSGNRLMQEVANMEQGFQNFGTVVKRFRNINVASRIEAAKQSQLFGITGTVSEMTQLTRRIETDVNDALTATEQFIVSTQSTIKEYTHVFVEEETFVDQFGTDIRSSYEELYAAQNSLAKLISGFAVYTTQFFALFDETQTDLEALSDLNQDIDGVKEQLGRIKSMAQDQMNALLRTVEGDSWTIHNEKLKSIISRFTIFTHKKTAGELGGFEVEDATAASGEVTFF